MRVSSPIAQSVERRTVNPQVPGSSPGRGAKFENHHVAWWFLFYLFISIFNILIMRGEMVVLNASIFRRPTSIFKYLIYFLSYT